MFNLVSAKDIANNDNIRMQLQNIFRQKNQKNLQKGVYNFIMLCYISITPQVSG